MTKWIISNRPDVYDIDTEFYSFKKIDWYQNRQMLNFQTGDIVYIYRSTPLMEIRWKCVIGKTKYYFDNADNIVYSDDNGKNDGPFVEIIAEKELVCGSLLSYSELKKHGLKSRLMGPQKVDGELLQYIEGVIDNYSKNTDIVDFVSSLNEDDIKNSAEKYSSLNANKQYITNTKIYKRNPFIAEYAKLRAKGKCQLCGDDAPFIDKKGKPYLESHHIIWLSKGGLDTIDNTVALCPNCHKKMHLLNNQDDLNYLIGIAKNK